MATVVKMTGATDNQFVFSNPDGYTRNLSQRSDGVLVFYHHMQSPSERLAAYRSYDLGLSWVQETDELNLVTDDEIHSLIFSDYKVHHIRQSSHKVAFPCTTFGDETAIAHQHMCSMIDENDDIHLIYKKVGLNSDLFYSIYSSGSWSSEEQFTATDSFSTRVGSIAKDSLGQIHILYVEPRTTPSQRWRIWYTYRNTSGSWQTAVEVDPSITLTDTLSQPTLLIDSNDNIHICFNYNVNAGGGNLYAVVYHGIWNGSNFDLTKVYDGESGFIRSTRPRMSIDDSDNLYIAYGRENTSGNADFSIYLIQSTDNGTTWGSEILIADSSDATNGTYSMVALMKDGTNYPGHNVLNSGVVGVYSDGSSSDGEVDIYFFYSDDVSYKFPVTGSPDFCTTTVGLGVTAACVNLTQNSFTSIDHLNGETVAILADGRPLAQEVISGGSLSTASQYGVVHVGIPYYSDFETLDIGLTDEKDTLLGRKIKVGNVNMQFIQSRGGWFGPDSANLYEAFTNQMVTYNQTQLDFNEELSTTNFPTVLYTGYIRVPSGSRYKNGGRVFFRQKDPLPVSIGQIIPEVSVGGNV